MLRALFLASLCFVSSRAAAGQTLSVLHIKVVLVDAERTAAPVARHVLLVSDNPASAPPRRVTTAANGTADVRLPPGNYTVESDQPVAFGGKAYQWTQTLDIVAGRDAVLELTTDNAEVSAVTSAPTAPTSPPAADPSFLLPRWQDSVVVIWTPTVRASGSVIDARGLIATNQRVIGAATSVEVQLTPGIKVAASVLAADSSRDVAVLWIDPTLVSSVRPVPLGCAPAAASPIVAGQILFTIEAPLNEPKDMTSGTVSRVEPRAIMSDFRLARGSEGGPVFTAGGDVVGITSLVDDKPASRRGDARVVRVDEVCEVVASAEKKMKGAAAPDGTLRPVDPVRPFPTDALKNSTQRPTDMSPYRMSSADFDVTFVTPVLTYRVREQADPAASGALMDFGNWSEYVADVPPVLLIRVTPKLVESFWTTVARGAAMTQGVSLPPIKRAKAGFSRMRAFCGDAEVTPIHPFKVERASETVSVYEGLYAFDPGALGPHCGTVKLVLYSEKAPEKGDTRPVDPNVLQHVWQDFAPYRDLR